MSANDAVRWLEVLIEDGAVGGERIISPDAVRETRASLVDVGGAFGEYSRDHYGLGWYVGAYGEDALVHHFGGFAGFRAHVSYMPDRKIGVAGFVNDDIVGFELPDLVANFIYDRMAGKADARAVANMAIDQLAKDRDELFARIAADAEKRAAREWLLSLPRSAYVGTFENDRFGKIVVTQSDDEMRVAIGNLSAEAEPFTQPDTIRVELIPYSGQVLKFIIEENNVVAALEDGRGNRFDKR
jgi:hypothetical protein